MNSYSIIEVAKVSRELLRTLVLITRTSTQDAKSILLFVSTTARNALSLPPPLEERKRNTEMVTDSGTHTNEENIRSE